ncbi:hypothetical protein AX15_007502 [Amanita polypyramis BW_CC]|nr:hypothetical protein AX15_007502 [Amanita polypyramis BW_CC]
MGTSPVERQQRYESRADMFSQPQGQTINDGEFYVAGHDVNVFKSSVIYLLQQRAKCCPQEHISGPCNCVCPCCSRSQKEGNPDADSVRRENYSPSRREQQTLQPTHKRSNVRYSPYHDSERMAGPSGGHSRRTRRAQTPVPYSSRRNGSPERNIDLRTRSRYQQRAMHRGSEASSRYDDGRTSRSREYETIGRGRRADEGRSNGQRRYSTGRSNQWFDGVERQTAYASPLRGRNSEIAQMSGYAPRIDHWRAVNEQIDGPDRFDFKSDSQNGSSSPRRETRRTGYRHTATVPHRGGRSISPSLSNVSIQLHPLDRDKERRRNLPLYRRGTRSRKKGEAS